MTNLEAQPGWPAARQLDRDEFASGGPDGNLNEHAKVFLARTEYLKQQKVDKSEIVQGQYRFTTLALFNSVKASIPPNSTVIIEEAGENQGTNTWNGTTLTKSAYDPLTQAKADATTKANAAKSEAIAAAATDATTKANAAKSEAIAAAATDATAKANAAVITAGNNADVKINKVKDLVADIDKNIDSEYIPLLVDANNKILIGYDTTNDKAIIAGGGSEESLPLKQNEDADNIPVLVDAYNNVLIGYDTINERVIAAGLDVPQDNYKPKYLGAHIPADINHLLFHGQSLSIGNSGAPILSTTQPYSNLTFDTNPRMESTATSLVPLIESLSPDGPSWGETLCSGAANYAVREAMLKNNIKPSDNVIFASTAGTGAAKISLLSKGTSNYQKVVDQITKAKELAGASSFKVQQTAWVQGEYDANVTATPYDVYKSALLKLQQDISDDAKLITGQTSDVGMITYQLSAHSKTRPDVALAQLDLVKESDLFSLATPIYHMPYADIYHLTNVGSKWLGAYFGRAYKQRVIDGRKPDFINPVAATLAGNVVTVAFNVPKLPLVIDNVTLAETEDAGFKVNDSTGVKINISGIRINRNKVILTLAQTPTANIEVRYALDYNFVGFKATEGGSGNLRDSTTDSVIIGGLEKPLYHVCPHFKLTAFLDKGI